MKQKLILSALYSHLSTLLVLCVAILSQLTLVSCNDDKLTEEEKQQKQEQEDDRQFLLTSEFWKVVGQLSDAEVLPDDWQHAIFEPGIGEASDKSTTTRIVLTNEAEAAAVSFEELTGADVTGLDAYEWKRDFGTLTYQRLHDGTGWAAVDVDIKQMPGLKRIVYCTPEQQGLNASVPGTPYYRFGDVIKKPNAQGVMEYWVCVRPCFGPEKKGDMHWMCLGSLPESNIETFKYTDGRQWWWYKSLTTKDEHIKNLSEMTYAIMNPTAWADYYEAHQNKYMFHDFHYENVQYINRYFWQLVQDAWNTKPEGENETVWELLFHRKMDEVKADNYLYFFYGTAKGPRWSWPIEMNVAKVTYPDFRKLGMQFYNRRADEFEFDIREYSKWGHADNSTYFKNSIYIYPLRYATGKQLLGSQPNYYQSMDGSNQIQDVYVFNKHYGMDFGSKIDMKAFEKGDVQKLKEQANDIKNDIKGIFYGLSFWRFGDVVKDKKDGSLWFCIQPSGTSEEGFEEECQETEFFASNKSYFISLTPGKFGSNEQNRSNLPSHDEAIAIAMNLEAVYKEQSTQKTKNDRDYAIEHIKEYAGVDLLKLIVKRDTTHNENKPEEKPYKNHQQAYFINLGYNDPIYSNQDKQPLVRVIYSGAARAIDDQGNVQYHDRWMEYLIWDRYEYGNKETMFLQDLASIDKVNMYASGDRWVTLPWYTTGSRGMPAGSAKETDYPHEKPRSTAYDDIKCSYFDWDETNVDFKNPTYRSMYNEPVVFCRLMAFHDVGKQELQSTDGRTFEVVKLIEKKDSWPDAVETRDGGLLCGIVFFTQAATIKKLYYYNGDRSKGRRLGEIDANGN